MADVGAVRFETALGSSGRWLHARTTTRDDGDLRIDGDGEALAAARRRVVDLPWVWVRQVHGATVHAVSSPDDAGQGATAADAVVTDRPGVALAVHTADCAPLVLYGADPAVIGVVHAGWRGLEAGVVAAAVDALRDLGAGSLRGVLQPCIHPECYEFGTVDLDRLAGRLGDAVRGRTSWGRAALDLPAAVIAACGRAGVETVVNDDGPACTACAATTYYSHRARGDTGRMATVAWMDDGPARWAA